MSVKEKILISACLTGENVKYNGKNNKIDFLDELSKRYILIPFCPEVEGGLPTPRPPAEIISKNPLTIINKEGKKVTKFFQIGAKKALKLCKNQKIKKALLKENSPSCGKNYIYNGYFNHTLKKGSGVITTLFIKNTIEVFTEKECKHLLI